MDPRVPRRKWGGYMSNDDHLRFEGFPCAAYQERTAHREPTEYFVSAMEFINGDNGDGRLAVDLGCGGRAETMALLARGWRVFAMDADPWVGAARGGSHPVGPSTPLGGCTRRLP